MSDEDQGYIDALVEEEIHLRRFGNVSEGQSHMQQRDKDSLWEQDRNSLVFAAASLKKTDSLTEKMMDTLQSFDGRVSRLLTSINQVQDKTTKWKTIHTNINKSLTSIEEILEKFGRIELARRVVTKGLSLQAVYEKQKEEADGLASSMTGGDEEDDLATTAEEGTFGSDDDSHDSLKEDSTLATSSENRTESEDVKKKSNVVDLDTYLLHLDSIVELEKFFQEHQRFKSAPEAIADLQMLTVTGMEHIYRFYDVLLLSNVQPLNVQSKGANVKIRRGKDDLMNSPIPDIVMDPRAIVQLVTEPVIRDLLKLIKRLQVSTVKASDGANNAKSYLQIYVDRRTQFLLDTMRNNFNESTLFVSYNIEDRSREKGLMSGMVNLLNADKVEQKKKLREVMNTSVTYEKGSHLFLLFMEVQLVLLRSERALAETLIPSKSQFAVFGKIVSPTLTFWAEMGDTALRTLKKNPNKVYGISVLLDVYGTLQQLLKLYEQVFANCPPSEELSSVTTFWAKLTSAGRQSFQQFRDDVKADPIRSLPTDATVHELTSTTLNYLRHLFEYKQHVVELLPPMPSVTKKSSLADYIVAVLTGLKENLDEKARKDKKVASLANVFLLNNFHFIWRSVENSELAPELGQRSAEVYRSWADEQKEAYRASLGPLLDYLNDEKYKEKDRLNKKTIKSRFKGFNDDFESLFKTQSAFYIPDDDLRELMRKDLRQRLLPPYRSFLDRFNDVPFTKNKGKYIKHSPEVLESSLNKFFGGLASGIGK